MEDYKRKLEEQLQEIEALLARANRKLEELRSVPDHEITFSYYFVKSKTKPAFYVIMIM